MIIENIVCDLCKTDLTFGDIVITSDGTTILICRDFDGEDYKIVNLTVDKVEDDYFGSIKTLVDYIEGNFGHITRIVKSDKVKLVIMEG